MSAIKISKVQIKFVTFVIVAAFVFVVFYFDWNDTDLLTLYKLKYLIFSFFISFLTTYLSPYIFGFFPKKKE
jgi:hypothetical protein